MTAELELQKLLEGTSENSLCHLWTEESANLLFSVLASFVTFNFSVSCQILFDITQ